MKSFRYPCITIALLLLGVFASTKSFAQPGNDECWNATSLSSSTSCLNTAGTNVNATWNPSSIPVVGCGASDKNDVWYTFVAQATTHTVTLSSAPGNIRVQILSGSCGSFTSLACGNNSVSYTNLTIGNLYYVRVYTQSNNGAGSFNICVTYSPPANDNCAGAISLTSNTTCVNTIGTLNIATPSGGTAGCFGAGTYYDVWYSFVALSGTETVTLSSLGANITNPQIQIYGGTCAGLTNLSACGTTSVTQSGLTVGATYYVRVANLNSDPSGSGGVAYFNICVTHTPPANDECSGAISITSNTSCSNTSGTLVGATTSSIASIGCGVANRNDVWYSFIAASANTTITLSSAPANTRIQLFSGSCASLTSVACASGTILSSTTLTPGTTYYVRIYTDPSTISASNTFNICVTHTGPANDDCSNPILLTSATSCINTAGTLNLATANGATALGCFAAGTYYDVWYSFVAAATTETVTLSGLGANITNPQIQIYTNSCTALGAPVCGTNSVIQTGLVVGTTYKIRVSNMGADPSGAGTTASFNICVTHIGGSNDLCQNATVLTSSTSCNLVSGNTAGSTYTAITGSCQGTNQDVWYSFVAQSQSPTIISNASSNRQRIELYSGSCGSLAFHTCGVGTTNSTISPTNLTIGATYYIRITTSNAGTNFTFDICVQDPTPNPIPGNDDCSSAVTLTPLGAGVTCSTPTVGTLGGATVSSPSVVSNCTGSPGADVWYVFTATSAFNQIALSTIGTSIQSGTGYVELYSGSCGSLTSINCSSGTGTTLNLLAGGTGLTVGNTYYIRVHTGSTNTAGSNWGFGICITTPGTASTATVEYSKSYVNLTKLSTGGGVEPGDILEIRATFIVRSGTVDSVAFYDTLQNNSGFTIVPGSLYTQTNEGKVYKGAFTDASDSDAGTVSTVPSTSDVAIKTYMETTNGGVPATRGTIAAGYRPRFSGTTIIMATYQVQVNASYDTRIDWGGGGFVYRDRSTGNMKLLSFKNDTLVVYASPGLCSSSLSANNQVGIESNGTFGTASNPTPLLRNRGTSTAVPSYTYAPFGPPTGGGGPNDYYYGIANNTSGNTYTASNVFPKQTLGSLVPQRVFALWDIIGDHTGATNTAKGNPPCDINQPVSATNPCGYMLVVNAAYKTDTAFRSTITNLCPNTYYEISAWVRNVCAKCGQDSTGKGAASSTAATAPAYVPFAQGDSSGVPPNLAFQINGQDYYTTGNIYYTGTDITGNGDTTQYAQDTLNRWVKRGFVYKTGATQTGFEFLIRNNAPGGGGNDWAIDDIVIATCSPEVTITPEPNPFICDSNAIDMGAIIASYYDSYTYYTWERSDDDGVTWTSTGISGGPITPTFSNGSWNYSVSYPSFIVYAPDSGSQYRVQIASTVPNLSNSSCRFSGGAVITLTVDSCTGLLDLDILSFKGRNESNYGVLYWTTSKEEEPVKYEIQKSKDGSRFVTIGEVDGFKNPSSEQNNYRFVDQDPLDNTLSWYRVKATETQSNKYSYTKVIQLIGKHAGLHLESLINPFTSQVKFDLISGDEGLVQVQILDQYQHVVKAANHKLVKGKNNITITNTDNLPAGFYILRVVSGNTVINKKIIKNG